MIDELVKKLKNSLVMKSKSHRLKMLVDDINKNRYRVKSILTNLNNVQEDDIKNALGRLAREELLSEEQYDKLINLEKMDLPTIARVINETKVGRGLSFLPRKVSDLRLPCPLIFVGGLKIQSAPNRLKFGMGNG